MNKASYSFIGMIFLTGKSNRNRNRNQLELIIGIMFGSSNLSFSVLSILLWFGSIPILNTFLDSTFPSIIKPEPISGIQSGIQIPIYSLLFNRFSLLWFRSSSKPVCIHTYFKLKEKKTNYG